MIRLHSSKTAGAWESGFGRDARSASLENQVGLLSVVWAHLLLLLLLLHHIIYRTTCYAPKIGDFDLLVAINLAHVIVVYVLENDSLQVSRDFPLITQNSFRIAS